MAFAPNNVGAHNATLTLTDNATSSPQHAALTGTGIAGLSTTSSSLIFGSVTFGTKALKSFYVTNHQTQSVTLSESFSGPNATDFSRSGGTCTATLAAGATCYNHRELHPRRPRNRIGNDKPAPTVPTP